MMTFAYIPRNELPVNDEPVHDRAREGSPVSFAGPSMSRDSRLGLDEGHVLVLNLHDTWTGQSAKGKPRYVSFEVFLSTRSTRSQSTDPPISHTRCDKEDD